MSKILDIRKNWCKGPRSLLGGEFWIIVRIHGIVFENMNVPCIWEDRLEDAIQKLLCFSPIILVILALKAKELAFSNYWGSVIIFNTLFQALEVQNKHSEGLAELFKVCIIHRIFPPAENSVRFSVIFLLCTLMILVCFSVQEFHIYLLFMMNQYRPVMLFWIIEMELHRHMFYSVPFWDSKESWWW